MSIVETRIILSDLIQNIRKREGLSKYRLALILGVSSETIANWEDARVDMPFSGITRLINHKFTDFNEIKSIFDKEITSEKRI